MAIATDKTVETVPVSIVSRKKGWSDLDLSLKRHPLQKDILPLKDDNAIKNAVKNLVLTNFYERPFQHSKGGNLQGLLFEPIEASSAITLEVIIRDMLNTYEPRISVISVNVAAIEERNYYDINITFSIINTEVETAVEFFLERLR